MRCAGGTSRSSPRPAWRRLPDGRTVRIDLAVPAGALGRRAGHPSRAPHARRRRPDARRNRQAHMVGWQIEPVTALDMADVEHLADEPLATLYHLSAAGAELADHPGVFVRGLPGTQAPRGTENLGWVRWWGLRCGGRRRRRGSS